MIASSRRALLGTFLFFAVGALLASAAGTVASFWAFLSPLQWVASLVVVITGQPAIAEKIVQGLSFSGHGACSVVAGAIMSGLTGLAILVSGDFIVTHTRRSSPLAGKLFLWTFAPIWALLVEYDTLSKTFPAFKAALSPLETQAPEIRIGTGFGIVLMAVITPMLALLCTKVVLLILHPERSYRDAA